MVCLSKEITMKQNRANRANKIDELFKEAQREFDAYEYHCRRVIKLSQEFVSADESRKQELSRKLKAHNGQKQVSLTRVIKLLSLAIDRAAKKFGLSAEPLTQCRAASFLIRGIGCSTNYVEKALLCELALMLLEANQVSILMDVSVPNKCREVYELQCTLALDERDGNLLKVATKSLLGILANEDDPQLRIKCYENQIVISLAQGNVEMAQTLCNDFQLYAMKHERRDALLVAGRFACMTQLCLLQQPSKQSASNMIDKYSIYNTVEEMFMTVLKEHESILKKSGQQSVRKNTYALLEDYIILFFIRAMQAKHEIATSTQPLTDIIERARHYFDEVNLSRLRSNLVLNAILIKREGCLRLVHKLFEDKQPAMLTIQLNEQQFAEAFSDFAMQEELVEQENTAKQEMLAAKEYKAKQKEPVVYRASSQRSYGSHFNASQREQAMARWAKARMVDASSSNSVLPPGPSK